MCKNWIEHFFLWYLFNNWILPFIAEEWAGQASLQGVSLLSSIGSGAKAWAQKAPCTLFNVGAVPDGSWFSFCRKMLKAKQLPCHNTRFGETQLPFLCLFEDRPVLEKALKERKEKALGDQTQSSLLCSYYIDCVAELLCCLYLYDVCAPMLFRVKAKPMHSLALLICTKQMPPQQKLFCRWCRIWSIHDSWSLLSRWHIYI